LVSYFLVGIVIAVIYGWVVRDKPEQHAGVNEAELELIGRQPDPNRPTVREFFGTLLGCTRSGSLWLNSFSQFGTNVGWTFLITWLPSYLADSQGVAAVAGATMVTLVLAVGMPGQLIGGVLGDAAVANFGLRWGRVLVPAVALAIAGFAYMACLGLASVWLIVACCAVVSLMTDIANPSTWAFMQDVGGRNTAAVFGWANMWGNFGAAFSAALVPRLMTWGETSGHGQDFVFIVCGGSFFVASILTLGMNATRPIRVGT
jgi:nitrate/nitrite transporter NarK